MNRTIATLFVILIVLINGFIFSDILERNKRFYEEQINVMLIEKDNLQEELKEFYKYGVKVSVTMYRPNRYETDSTPNITADGTRIRINKASDYKFVALSRNLLKRWGGSYNFKDFILLKGAGHKDGIYQIRDTMNPRFINTVDILESIDVKPYKYENVNLYKMNWTDNIKLVSNE